MLYFKFHQNRIINEEFDLQNSNSKCNVACASQLCKRGLFLSFLTHPDNGCPSTGYVENCSRIFLQFAGKIKPNRTKHFFYGEVSDSEKSGYDRKHTQIMAVPAPEI